MAKELQKTLKLENEEYNINAVRSDTAETADKTQHKLIINESGINVAEFDGSVEKTINYVNAEDGGKFSGPVFIDNKYTTVSEEDIPKNAIVNFGQVNTRIRELTGAPLYTWNNDSQLKQLVASTGEFHRLNAIAGTLENFETFKRLLGIPNSTATTKPQAYCGVKLSARKINDVDCAAVTGYEDCGYTNVIIPYVGYIDYEDEGTDYNNINRTIARPVVTILDKAFDTSATGADQEGLKKIESIVIPASVTAIGQYAFRGCVGLKSVVIPSSVTSVGSSAFSGCTSLKTVYYNGTDEDWADITIGSSNDYLKNATREPYNNSPETINFKEIIEKPFIYICTDALDSAVSHPNTIFLKLPGNFSFIELSKGATRLDSTSNTVSSQSYYTYETLAAIIAGINSRLAALGSTTLTLPKTLTTLGATVIPEDIPKNLQEEILIDQNAVSTIQEIESAILSISGLSASFENSKISSTAANWIANNCTDSLAQLRDDLDELTKEVNIVLDDKDSNTNISGRLATVEATLTGYGSETTNTVKTAITGVSDRVGTLEKQIKDKKDDSKNGHGYHIPTPVTGDDIKNNSFLRNDNSWQTVTPSNIGAAPTDHASNATTYGVATETLYGHVKASTTAGASATDSGAVGTANGIYANADHSHPLQTSVTGNAGSADKVNKALTFSSDGSGDSSGSIFDGSAAKTISYNSIGALSASTAYAASTTAGGAATSANKVNNSLTIKLNSGDSEDTNLFSFDGSADKIIDITPSNIGALVSTTRYAGANQQGGAASSAEKLTNNAIIGSVSVPVYFTADGVPAACTSLSLNTSGNAATATIASSVSGEQGTANAARHVWFSDSSESTKRVYADNFKYNPSSDLLNVGNVSATGQIKAQTFNANSDARLKENFEPLVVEKSILDLPTYKFDFINGAKNQVGCKAQDLKEICPEIVDEGSDGYLSIQESKIVYLLLEEVKKLKAEINKLKCGDK